MRRISIPFLLSIVITFAAIFTFALNVLAVEVFVSTGGVSNITNSSAVLQGTFSTDYYGSFNRPVAWIEYGVTEDFGYLTPPRQITSRTPVIQAQVNGLLPNTKYYVRAVAQSDEGLVFGKTLSFVTTKSDGSPGDGGQLGVVPATPPGTTTGGTTTGTNTGGTTGTGTTTGGTGTGTGTTNPTSGVVFNSQIYVSIDDGFEQFTEQDILTYTLDVRNLIDEDLENVYAIVELPAELAYLGDNGRAIYRPQTHELIFTIGNMDEKDEKTFQFDTRLSRIIENGQQIIAKVTVVYTDSQEKLQYQAVDLDINTFQQENAIIVGDQSDTAAPKNTGRVILVLAIILILLIIIALIGRKIYLKHKEEREQQETDDLFASLRSTPEDAYNGDSVMNPQANPEMTGVQPAADPNAMAPHQGQTGSFNYDPNQQQPMPDVKPGIFDDINSPLPDQSAPASKPMEAHRGQQNMANQQQSPQQMNNPHASHGTPSSGPMATGAPPNNLPS